MSPPTLGDRLALAWPLVVPAVLLGFVSEGRAASALLAVAVVACAIAGGRISLDRASQRVLALVGAGVAFALHRAFAGAPVAGELHPAWISTARAALAFGALRLLVEEPDGGYVATVVLGAIAMVACGEIRLGPGYAATVVAFLVVSVWAMRVADGKRAALAAMPRRARIVAGAMPLVALAIALTIAAPMRPISKWFQRKMERYYEDHFLNGKVGFSDQMRLGRMTRLLDSDEVALRIRGPRLGKNDLLRGAIFDHYDHGNWSFTQMTPAIAVGVAKGRQRGADVFEVRRGSADSERMFLPGGMRGLSTPSGSVKVDGGGVARRASKTDTIYWFRAGARDELPIQEPTPEDGVVESGARGRLQALAHEWADGAKTKAEALERIEARLRKDFVYSLTSNHSKAHEPVLDFLFRNRQGHCEYFASSMVLLARSIGIPARAVAGYRVRERSAYLETYVVRERDAHSWVEAYVAGEGWRTFDPTPEVRGDGERQETQWFAAVEGMAYVWDTTEAWLADRTLVELIGTAVAGAALFVFLRARRRRGAVDGETRVGYAAPLPAFERLAAALAARGHVRGASEPLETYAKRIADDELAALVERYAALRYGDAPDVTLEADLDAAALRVQRG